jgi:hypothetical protein
MHFHEGHNRDQQPEHNEQQPAPNVHGQKDRGRDSSPRLAAGQCRHIKPDGSPCRANVRSGSLHCYFHCPDVAEEREAARIKGGKERSRKAAVLPSDTPNMELTSAADVTALLAETINQVRRGELDPRVSNAVGYLAGVLLKTQEQHEFERRLLRVESIFRSKWADRNAVADPMFAPESFEFVKAKSGGEA